MSHQPNEGVRPSMQMATGATVSGKVDVGGMDETEYLQPEQRASPSGICQGD